jgi:hypothetical protein
MNTWKIVGVDPDNIEETCDGALIATVDDTRGVALARGCEAILDGWIDVVVTGPLGMRYPLVGVA